MFRAYWTNSWVFVCAVYATTWSALLHMLANFVVVDRIVDKMLAKNAINKFQAEHDKQEEPKEFIVDLAFN